MDRTIGIGAFVISKDPEDFIKTYALASCVAVTLYNPSRQVAGMIHIALPNPSNSEEARRRPAYYASSGLPLLIRKLSEDYGCQPQSLEVKLFGGAVSIKKQDYFNIGPRNIQAVQEIFWRMGLNISVQQIGGYVSRSIIMSVKTGDVEIATLPLNC